MPSSELSDALNPNVVRQRTYDNALVYQDQRAHTDVHHPNFHYEQYQQQPHEYVRHRSELELAVVEPMPVQRPRPAPANPELELLRLWRESDQAENNRRLAWEKDCEARLVRIQEESEARLTRIQEESEGRLRTMQEEIDSLKEDIRHLKSVPTAPAVSQNAAPETTHNSTPFQDLPQDHLSNRNTPHPLFVQGSSTDPTPYQGNEILDDLVDAGDNLGYTRKRTASPPSGDDESSDYDLPLDTSRPNKRINGHDTRRLTIQHVMRSHLHKLMAITEDGPLPANHIEGAPLTDDEPVRFIWGRTVKQSQHNARMKKRVINDLIGSKGLYEHVPQEEFTAENLETVFDQTFSTLRSKYKAQTDANVAQRRKEKEINKMIKTRRNNRKRAKLELRSACREKNESYSHPAFDGAFQLECMSSEESEDGSTPRAQLQPRSSGRAPKSSILRVRGLGWRSSRLVALFHILDETGQSDPALSSTLPRGDKGKQKTTGETKDTNKAGTLILPPKGVSTWMISRRWLRRASLVHGSLGILLGGLVVEHPGFDWRAGTVMLGHGSETEEEPRYRMQYNNSSSSLQYALAHP